MSRARRAKAASAPASGLLPLDEPMDGLGWGLRIHRRYKPKDWLAQLEHVPEQHRAEAEQYLRGIAERMRVLRDMGKG
jgi:hypothetical protein